MVEAPDHDATPTANAPSLAATTCATASIWDACRSLSRLPARTVGSASAVVARYALRSSVLTLIFAIPVEIDSATIASGSPAPAATPAPARRGARGGERGRRAGRARDERGGGPPPVRSLGGSRYSP